MLAFTPMDGMVIETGSLTWAAFDDCGTAAIGPVGAGKLGVTP
jgi:hypothetical protein